jgi:hypothetical protein
MPHRREFVLILSIALGFIISFPQISKGAAQQQTTNEGRKNKNANKQLIYKNKPNGFCFSLPMSEKGYRILMEQRSDF